MMQKQNKKTTKHEMLDRKLSRIAGCCDETELLPSGNVTDNNHVEPSKRVPTENIDTSEEVVKSIFPISVDDSSNFYGNTEVKQIEEDTYVKQKC